MVKNSGAKSSQTGEPATSRRKSISDIVVPERVTTGTDGLDTILRGGLLARRRYLVRGGPGLGKTTLGLNFLAANGADDSSLFIGFQEPEDELRANAATVGINTDGIRFLSLAPTEEFFTGAEAYDVFAASDVEQAPMIRAVVEAVEATRPTRVFIDSLTQLRFISADLAQFRKQVLSFLSFLTDRGATVLFTSESTREVPDDDLQFICDGIIDLQRAQTSGNLTITKFRGSGYLRGKHQFRVDGSGFEVFPHILPPQSNRNGIKPVLLRSGNEGLDAMLGGGLESGTVTLLTGPSGIGKSTLSGLFAVANARAGRPTAIYQFEEELQGWISRLTGLGVDVDTPVREGLLVLEQVEPLRYMADEFINSVRRRIEEDKLELVIIDSITGFELTLEGDQVLNHSLHAFIKTLSRLGVAVILINQNRAITGDVQISERDISYIADNVIYLRYVQTNGGLDKVIGVLKKRLSDFDTRQHQFEITQGGIRIGDLASKLGIDVSVGQTPTVEQ
ncbi:MAG: ATPase domain-containing protein [Pseudohongiellaceae bacterium]